MDVTQKLQILGSAARYDVSCSSSGVGRSGKKGAVGNAVAAGICHTWTDDGRCLSLLKVLLSNACEYDCLYCANRRGNDIQRATFQPAELADLTMEFYRRNYIEGLFLSSAVSGGPDATMERMNEVMRRLRVTHRYQGYIHAKIVPGASYELVEEMGRLADRVSVNMELCSTRSLALLAPQKAPLAIAAPMRYVTDRRLELLDSAKHFRHVETFAPAGQSTQVMIGVTPERDLQVLGTAQRLYDHFNMKRVYYSAYIPINDHPNLPAPVTAPPLLREHRLYQADWLLRFYDFRADELLDASVPDLDLDVDPKCAWALRHPERFPVDVNQAWKSSLLRVPGIGPISARRIVAARAYGKIRFEHLARMGVVIRRAAPFIRCVGRPTGLDENRAAVHGMGQAGLRLLLADRAGKERQSMRQLRLEDV